MSRCASQLPHVAPPEIGRPEPRYRNGTREYVPATPNEVPPPPMVFSNDALYCQLVELPKSQELALRPSLTPLPVKPAMPPLTHVSGSLVNTRCRRCALSDAAHNINIRNATEKRLIIKLQAVLQLPRVGG